MKLKYACCIPLLLLLTACGKTPVPPLMPEDVALVRDNKYSCTYADIKHDFVIDLPDNPEHAPLIVMLHGYGESAEGFRSNVHLEKQANPLGYAVAYVSGGMSWNSGLEAEGNPDTDFLVSLAHYLQDTYKLDDRHTYAAGFSNGAFMVHRLAMEASDTFSACISVAGMMPARIWDAREKSHAVNFFQITGEKDDVVPKKIDGSADRNVNPAIEDVIDYYVQSGGLSLSEETVTENGSVLTRYGKGNHQVWNLFVKKGTHTWNSSGDTNDLILEYLEAQK